MCDGTDKRTVSWTVENGAVYSSSCGAGSAVQKQAPYNHNDKEEKTPQLLTLSHILLALFQIPETVRRLPLANKPANLRARLAADAVSNYAGCSIEEGWWHISGIAG